eukprot:GSMAST32.ASY1.ANO1.1565.1 assembled CDS
MSGVAVPKSAYKLSSYELARLANIKRNEEVLRSLGLDPKRFTKKCPKEKRPLKRRIVSHEPTRRSNRLAKLETPDYKEEQNYTNEDKSRATSRQKALAARLEKQNRSKRVATPINSIKVINVDVEKLDKNWLGKVIPPRGGQVKAAVMDLAGGQRVRFSRMSGIQAWHNAILLFINVYGDEYKNVFLDSGREITWFAQNSQWEGTPVIQRLINSSGGIVTYDIDGRLEEEEWDETPVLLFCRVKGSGYTYCGRLEYVAHNPEELPIRFIWRLRAFDGYKEEFVKDSNENNGSNLTKDINTDKNNSNQALGKDKSSKSKRKVKLRDCAAFAELLEECNSLLPKGS